MYLQINLPSSFVFLPNDDAADDELDSSDADMNAIKHIHI